MEHRPSDFKSVEWGWEWREGMGGDVVAPD